MASICKEILIDAPVDQVWDALRDFGALHERLVPGFVVAAEMHGDVRVITFFNGSVAQERLVGTDDEARRLAYTVIDGPLGATHHNASAQVMEAEDGRSRFVWVTDVLPDELDAPVSGLMDRGLATIKETLE
jgi:Polyketide cyclase / dehydrase and lipid transport